MRGAQLMVVIANWPRERDEHWRLLLRARAIENQAYVAGVNRTGRDPNLSYIGHSQIIDPHGNVVGDAGESPGVIAAELDLAHLLSYRREFPALSDLRPEYFKL